MTRKQLKRQTKAELIDWILYMRGRLDELSEEDFFGTEGWQQFFGLDDSGDFYVLGAN